jgi:hypothetical protein
MEIQNSPLQEREREGEVEIDRNGHKISMAYYYGVPEEHHEEATYQFRIVTVRVKLVSEDEL